MDIKKIVNICKKKSAFRVNKTNDGCQWFGDGKAMYLLSPDIPFLSAEVISGLYELSKDKVEEEYRLHCSLSPGELELLADTMEDEEMLVPLHMNVVYGGTLLLSFRSNQGLILIDSEYLNPLESKPSELMFTLRGENIVAVKDGMFITAIVSAYDVNRDDDFTEKLKQLYKLNSISREKEFLKNKNFDEMEGTSDEQEEL